MMSLEADDQWTSRLLTGAIFFAPLVVAGVMLSLAGYGRRRDDERVRSG